MFPYFNQQNQTYYPNNLGAMFSAQQLPIQNTLLTHQSCAQDLSSYYPSAVQTTGLSYLFGGQPQILQQHQQQQQQQKQLQQSAQTQQYNSIFPQKQTATNYQLAQACFGIANQANLGLTENYFLNPQAQRFAYGAYQPLNTAQNSGIYFLQPSQQLLYGNPTSCNDSFQTVVQQQYQGGNYDMCNNKYTTGCTPSTPTSLASLTVTPTHYSVSSTSQGTCYTGKCEKQNNQTLCLAKTEDGGAPDRLLLSSSFSSDSQYDSTKLEFGAQAHLQQLLLKKSKKISKQSGKFASNCYGIVGNQDANDAEADQAHESHLQLKRRVNSRNTIKNIVNQMISFLSSPECYPILESISTESKTDLFNLFQAIIKHVKRFRRKIKTVDELINMWRQTPEKSEKFSLYIRILSRHFLERESVVRIITSKYVKDKSYHLEIRRFLIETLKRLTAADLRPLPQQSSAMPAVVN